MCSKIDQLDELWQPYLVILTCVTLKVGVSLPPHLWPLATIGLQYYYDFTFSRILYRWDHAGYS